MTYRVIAPFRRVDLALHLEVADRRLGPVDIFFEAPLNFLYFSFVLDQGVDTIAVQLYARHLFQPGEGGVIAPGLFVGTSAG